MWSRHLWLCTPPCCFYACLDRIPSLLYLQMQCMLLCPICFVTLHYFCAFKNKKLCAPVTALRSPQPAAVAASNSSRASPGSTAARSSGGLGTPPPWSSLP